RSRKSIRRPRRTRPRRSSTSICAVHGHKIAYYSKLITARDRLVVGCFVSPCRGPMHRYPELPAPEFARPLRRRLLAGFRRAQRDLPWRRDREAYHIWVSEIMLQQTQVATVVPYYRRFLAAFPTIKALAEASENDVLRVWEGLGYYRRARDLHRA